MFISMPKDFFVPVLFNDKFEFDLETGQMQYDTNKRDKINIDISMDRGEDASTYQLKDTEKAIKEKVNTSLTPAKKEIKNISEEEVIDIQIEVLENILIKTINDKADLCNLDKVSINGKTFKDDLDDYLDRIEDIINQHIKKYSCGNIQNDEADENKKAEVYKKLSDITNEHFGFIKGITANMKPEEELEVILLYFKVILMCYIENIGGENNKNINSDKIEELVQMNLNKINDIFSNNYKLLKCNRCIENDEDEEELNMKNIEDKVIYEDNLIAEIDDEYIDSLGR